MSAPGYYDHVRIEILPLLPGTVDRVFEIGCGSGATLAYLKENGFCHWVGGIEPMSAAARRARERTDLFIEGNIESVELPLQPKSIDAILCLDVLEHLVDPWKVMKRLSYYLKPGGFIIASIPNVRFYKVVLDLLLYGRWVYTDAGILDHTHLRFFTRSSAIELLESGGMKVDAVLSTGLKKGKGRDRANKLTLGLLENFFTYQYVLRARES